jgi:hypothetical protein
MKSQGAKKAQKEKKPSKIASGKATPGKWDEMNRKQRREMMRQMQSEDLSLEVVHPHAAGIDIGNESHYVAVPPSRDPQPVRCFGCTTAELKKMAEWLTQCGIRTVATVRGGVLGVWPWFRQLSAKQQATELKSFPYCTFAYSALASFRMGMSGSASFQSVRKSL